MNVFIVTQKDRYGDFVIVGVYSSFEAARECREAGDELRLGRFIDICGVQNQYDANEDLTLLDALRLADMRGQP